MSLLSVPLPALFAYAEGSRDIPFSVELVGQKQGPTVMITALIHGNEICGAHGLDRFLKSNRQIEAGRLICLFANISAYRQFNRRYPYANRYIDQDMNRIWSDTVLFSKLKNSELKRARQIWTLIQEADYLLDLHSMGAHQTPLILAGRSEDDIAFARQFRLTPYIISDTGHPQGTRLRDYKFKKSVSSQSFGPIALLLECGQHWQVSSVDVALAAIDQMLYLTGLTREKPIDLIPDAPKVIEVTDAIQVNYRDFKFEAHVTQETLRQVGKGEVIAHEKGRQLIAPYDACYLIMPTFEPVIKQIAVRLGRERLC